MGRAAAVGSRSRQSRSRQHAVRSRVASPARRSRQPQAAVGSLDRLIHERLRLGIVSALAVNERLTFNDLKRLLQTTDGNLSVHARKLEDAEYIASRNRSRARAADRIPPHRRRQARARQIPRSHGGADQSRP